MRAKSLFGALAIFIGLTARAGVAQDIPDPNKEQDFRAKLIQCGICHGAKGKPKPSEFPIIWGQQQNYLIKQMRDFHSGERDSELMLWISKNLSSEDARRAAVNFAKRKWPTKSEKDAASAPSAPRGVDACERCHASGYVGTPQAPRLAGQNYEYLVETMRQFAEGQHKDPTMADLMRRISPADREEMARYLSSL
jgi:cytochrome c553